MESFTSLPIYGKVQVQLNMFLIWPNLAFLFLFVLFLNMCSYLFSHVISPFIVKDIFVFSILLFLAFTEQPVVLTVYNF